MIPPVARYAIECALCFRREFLVDYVPSGPSGPVFLFTCPDVINSGAFVQAVAFQQDAQ